jgi:hypothetical protein
MIVYGEVNADAGVEVLEAALTMAEYALDLVEMTLKIR